MLLTREQGKSLPRPRARSNFSAAYVRWFAEEAQRIYGDVIPSPWPGRRILVTKEPVGVVGAITPWNFPSSMIARKLGPALAAGCTIVIKPAAQTPYSGLAWGALCEKAGIPAGVVNVLTGSARAIGGELTSNPLVRKITFTGSTPIGKMLVEQSAKTLKKVSMELGGNAPFIVFDDADIDRADRRRADRQISAIPARPASAPIAFSCRPAFTTPSSRKLVAASEGAQSRQRAWSRACSRGR